MSRGPSWNSMVKGSVDFSSFESHVLRLDMARTDDVDNVDSVLKFKDVKAYRDYFEPLLFREMRSNIRSTLQEHGQNLLVCHCKSSKVLHGSYGPPSGQLHSPSASTIISPVYAASQYKAISESEPKKPFHSTIFVEFSCSQHVRPDPNADTLEQHDLVSIDLVDKRPLDSAGGAAARPPSPSGILISKYGNGVIASYSNKSSVVAIGLLTKLRVTYGCTPSHNIVLSCFYCENHFVERDVFRCRYSIFGIVHRVRANKIEIQLNNSFGHPTLKELVCEGTACTLLRIDSLVTFRRKFAALQRMGSSPLCEGLLNPGVLGNARLMGHYLPANEHLDVLTPRFKEWLRDCLNSCQWDCVQRICSKTSPRVSLLQGPPGTGKTRVTLALLNCFILMRFQSHSQSLIKVLDVQNASKAAAAAAVTDKTKKTSMLAINSAMQPIHRNHIVSRPHILVCAPSNAAVDELLLRITTCSTELRDFGCSVFRPPVVRVGNSEMMNENIMNVSLDSQVDKYLYMKFNEAKAKLEELTGLMAKKQFEIRLLEQEYHMLPHLVESFKKVIIDLKEDEHNLELKMERLRICMECMALNKADTLAACHKSALHTAKSVLESSLLDEAMVVFTTLTSAGRDSLATVTFDVVLIDEACQSVELETLIPLCLGAKRCVLIGDPQQLPATVMSTSMLYRRSLFDRLQASGVELFMLTQQYRMHSDICLFPSQYFYGTNLVCDESVGRREPLPKSPDFWVPPFVVFNISSTSSRSGSGFMNRDEVSFVQLYIQHILRRHSDIKIANFVVLTPYRAQVKAIKSALPDIRVSTVDSFQGQESDFVVFSAVRAGSSGIGFVKDMQRLNVAITRAKHALIIVCDVRTMESNEGWRNLIRSANARGLLSHVPVASNGPFKQQVEHFLSKPNPFDVFDPPSQRQKQQKPQNQSKSMSSGTADPRLQPTLQIASCAVPLPSSLQSAAPARQAPTAAATSRQVDPAPQSNVVAANGNRNDAHGAAISRPQKRAASPPTREPRPQSQFQQLPQAVQQRPGEQRVADRAAAEQERQRLLQESQKDSRMSSPVPPQSHPTHQHQKQPSTQSLQPAIKRERPNEPPTNFKTEAATTPRGGPVDFTPPAYFAPAPRSNAQIERPRSHLTTPPPPPSIAPPCDPSKSPLKEQLLAVERLFAVPVLCSILQHQCRSWTPLKTSTVSLTLSRALHSSLSMTYDAEALRVFITRLQSGSNPYASAAHHSATLLPEELTAKLANVIRQVLASHSNMS